MAHLILVRHGKSEWNALGLWTGWTDVGLAPEGLEEARRAGEALRDFEIHEAHTSRLKRARHTLDAIQLAAEWKGVPVREHEALNERHYGVHTGKNKWDVRQASGEEEFKKISRGWDHPILEGETLKDVHGRVVPYYQEHVRPSLQQGKNIIIVAHNHSLRALVKHLESLSDDAIVDIKLGNAEALCYTFNEHMVCVHKEIRPVGPAAA